MHTYTELGIDVDNDSDLDLYPDIGIGIVYL